MKAFIFGGILVAGTVLLVVSPSKAAVPTPRYELLRKDGKFSIRAYPELLVATVPMQEGMNGSFRKLFRYITGANAGAQKISMTAPVLIDSKTQTRTMSFIMPSDSVPRPSDPAVSLEKIAPSKYAAFRFSGGRSAENESKATRTLRDWMESQKLEGEGEPIFAYYDPPWILPFLRHNEVLIAIR